MRSTGHTDRIVIIGGGISGLSSAFYLMRQAQEQGRPIKVTIVEAADSLGGKINTLRRDGFVIEKGPDSFLARKLPIIELTRELGLENELAATNPAAKKTYILNRGKLHPMPPGLVLGIPTEIMPFAKSNLLSVKGKLRALLDFVLPKRLGTDDESIGGFLERRVGTEVMERVAEPLLAGIYAGELRKLSLRATFPQFREAELKHGSLIRGMRANRKAGTAAQSRMPAVAKNSVFLTYRNGLSTLVDALDKTLADVDRRMGTKVKAIYRVEEAVERISGVIAQPQAEAQAGKKPGGIADMQPEATPRYMIELDSGEQLAAEAIIMTAPAFSAAELISPHMDASELEAIRYVSVANVVLAFDKATFGLEFDGSGFVVPRTEGRHITACTWTSAKWLHSSPGDKVLLRCYVGRSGDEESVSLPDEQLKALVCKDIEEIMGITAEPLFVEITRLHRSMPQYPVGHVENMARLRQRAAEKLPCVWITGAAFDGVGLPDCVRQGKEAAKQTLHNLTYCE
ncbi:protoporphyrinogen oxidase [Paenibacillus abyssi]|uniref:Coproporphyrinogen III oxidase n=2 Tax=Paenibacillus abyssi TaxID=1340531 RepID=A0A917G027_9BACL|nr:protoporphyrinogen oxidase [Paenibacillus abyssi]GGG15675.1 protoporphyrinogen oxidase [Paenibacillus abyssi]